MSCCVRDFRDKEVINICDGKRLGYVCDVEVDTACGQIRAIIVPGENKFLGFGKGCDTVIPWNNIRCIGNDIILVELGGLQNCK